MKYENKTIQAMVRMYCKAHHSSDRQLCRECSDLLIYAFDRIEKCPFGTNKPVCNSCTIHCYEKNRRLQISKVMRYAGPRMIWSHPILAVRHLIRSKSS